MPTAIHAELDFTPPEHLAELHRELSSFAEFGAKTLVETNTSHGSSIPVYVNEFWTAKQRAANRLHEISYRACFKPQLPRFFIERLTQPGGVVYDPFMGRGTTLLEASLLGRVPFGSDANPLCQRLLRPRLVPPTLEKVAERLDQIDLDLAVEHPAELDVFYHPKTLQEICALREYLNIRDSAGENDLLDQWIQMVALNRLTGHSAGFFSVYTLPPNQAVSIASQKRINAQRNQAPGYRSVRKLVLKKSKQLLGDISPSVRALLASTAGHSKVVIAHSTNAPLIPTASVDLVVTSPPFLDVVDYETDNWLRCWFIGHSPQDSKLSNCSKLSAWQAVMTETLRETHRVLRPGGFVAFEVGEVQRGKVRLEDAVIPAGKDAGLEPVLVLINAQEFTKTANCWGVQNNSLGTNTNRIVLFRKRH